jgi:hypothetical protein
MTELQSDAARCPPCSARISPLQAAWYGARRPFRCRRCDATIEKESARYFVAAPLIVICLAVFRARSLEDPVAWLAFVGGCAIVTVDSLLFSRIRLAAPRDAR